MAWGHKSDVWGLAVVGLELVKGTLYFESRDDLESIMGM
jgi:hypothetical protein